MQVHGKTLWKEAEQAQQWQTLAQKDVVQVQDQTWPKESATTAIAVYWDMMCVLLHFRGSELIYLLFTFLVIGPS